MYRILGHPSESQSLQQLLGVCYRWPKIPYICILTIRKVLLPSKSFTIILRVKNYFNEKCKNRKEKKECSKKECYI